MIAHDIVKLVIAERLKGNYHQSYQYLLQLLENDQRNQRDQQSKQNYDVYNFSMLDELGIIAFYSFKTR